jgi:hypothetical protein
MPNNPNRVNFLKYVKGIDKSNLKKHTRLHLRVCNPNLMDETHCYTSKVHYVVGPSMWMPKKCTLLLILNGFDAW